MKKLSILLVALAMVSCKKDNAKTANGKNQTQAIDSSKAKAPVEEKEVFAIKDSAGIYQHSFLFEKGQKLPFTTLQKETSKINAPNGQTQTINRESTDVVTFTVDDIVNNVYDITIDFVSKRTSMTMNGKTEVIDTQLNAPTNQEMKNKWTVDKALMGNQLKMKVDQKGNILSIKGFEPIYTKISSTLGKLVKDAKVKSQIEQQIKMGFNEDILKNQFSNSMLIMPSNGAKIGEKWTKTDNVSYDGKIKLITNYTVKSLDNGQLEITISGGIPKQSDKESKNGVTHTVSSEMSQVGKVLLDQKTGWITNQDIKVTTTQKESMSDGKQSQTITSANNNNVIINPLSKKK